MDQQMDARRPSVTWDEEVIAEHNLLRGTRMKIDEPDTPFAYGEDGLEELDESIEFSGVDIPAQPNIELKSNLNAAAGAAEQAATPNSKTIEALSAERQAQANEPLSLADQWSTLSCKLEEVAVAAEVGELHVGAAKVEISPAKKKAFKDKRAAHYNEFQRLKDLRAKGLLDADEDAEESGYP